MQTPPRQRIDWGYTTCGSIRGAGEAHTTPLEPRQGPCDKWNIILGPLTRLYIPAFLKSPDGTERPVS